MASFGISGVELSGSATTELETLRILKEAVVICLKRKTGIHLERQESHDKFFV
jgi:hypothetical protein